MGWGPHVSGSSCHVSEVDFGQHGQLGPPSPQAATQGWGPPSHVGGWRRNYAGEAKRRGAAREVAGNPRWWSVSSAGGSIRMSAVSRI